MLRRVYMGLCTTAYLLVLFSFNVTSNAKRRLVLTLLHLLYMAKKKSYLLLLCLNYTITQITLLSNILHFSDFKHRNIICNSYLLSIYWYNLILVFLRILFNKSEWHHYWIVPVFLYIYISYNTLSSSQTDWTVYIL